MGILRNKPKSKYYEVKLKKFFKKYNYYLIGLDKYFHYYILEQVTSKDVKVLRDRYPDYDRFTILTMDKKNNVVNILNDNNFVQNNPVAREDLELRLLESYEGSTLSIKGLNLYAKYIVYEIVGKKKELVLISEDFSITSPALKNNKTYYVEAYYGYEDHYVLYNKSKPTKCEYTKVEKKDFVLTIGIPVFNTETFIPRTLDSIILNTFPNFKILVINDGSKDNSAKVLDWYAKKYDFIEVHNDEWGGLSHVRNKMLDIVDTKYIGFSDSDDILSPDMYSELYKYIEKYQADVAICKTIERADFNKYSVVLQVPVNEVLVYDYERMAYEKYNRTKYNIFFVSTVNKIMKTEIAKKVRFTENNHYEDTGYTPSVYTYINKFVFVPYIMYVWDKRQRQTTGTYSTSYEALDRDTIYHYLYEGLSYAVYNGKKDNLDYVKYCSIQELLDIYFNQASLTVKSKDELKERIINIINDTDIENNTYIQGRDNVKFQIESITSKFTPPRINIFKDILEELNKKK